MTYNSRSTSKHGQQRERSGLRPATNQLENRQRRFALRLLSLPRGEKARNVVGANTAIGKRLAKALNYTWTETEETVLLEEPGTLDMIQEERGEAKREAEEARPGLVMFTDGSRTESGAAGYAVAWKNGLSWKGIKTHMGYNQEAFDADVEKGFSCLISVTLSLCRAEGRRERAGYATQ